MKYNKLLEQFKRYEAVRVSGKYNMIMNAREAAAEADLHFDDYMFIINHYSELYEKYKDSIEKHI